MKIAIMHCRNASNVCTGAGCMSVFNKKEKHFEQYKNQDIELCAFIDCNGCSCNRETDEGFIEKMDRLKSMNVDKIHIGVCIYKYCEHFESIKNAIERYGFEYELGTH